MAHTAVEVHEVAQWLAQAPSRQPSQPKALQKLRRLLVQQKGLNWGDAASVVEALLTRNLIRVTAGTPGTPGTPDTPGTSGTPARGKVEVLTAAVSWRVFGTAAAVCGSALRFVLFRSGVVGVGCACVCLSLLGEWLLPLYGRRHVPQLPSRVPVA